MLIGTYQSWCRQRQRAKGQAHYQPSNNQLDALVDILCDQGQHALALESVILQGFSSQHAAAAAAAIFKSAEATKATLQASVVRTCLQQCAGSDRESILLTGVKVIYVALLFVVQSIAYPFTAAPMHLWVLPVSTLWHMFLLCWSAN